MEDRRLRTRLNVRYPVTMTTFQGTVQGETKDLSTVGAFICCDVPLQPKEKVCLCIELRSGSSGEMDAEVIWATAPRSDDANTPRGMGIRFLW